MTTTKILIIEDEQLQQRAMARVLQSDGYETCVAGDAVEAISTAVREHPDLVLLDLGLPAGDGAVVLERLRNLPATSVTPVIVVTGEMVDDARRYVLSELGCNIVLTKPVSPEQLLRAVTDTLGDRHSHIEVVGQH
jgi:DNA-binding response OmpR family regulator